MFHLRYDNLLFWALSILALFPLFPVKVVNASIAFFLLVSLVKGFPYKHITISYLKQFAPFLLLFTLIAIYCNIIDSSAESKFYFEKSLSLLVFPLAFMLMPNQFNKQQKLSFYLLFSIAVVLISLFGITQVAILMKKHIGINQFWPTWADMFNDNSLPHLIRSNFEQVTSLHSTYASLLLGVAFINFLQMFQSISNKSLIKKIMSVAVIILILLMQTIIAARTPFIATLIAGCVFLLFSRQKKTALIITLFISVCFLAAMLSPLMLSRFKEVNQSNLNLPTAKEQNSFNIRTGIYHCSKSIIKKHWLWGVGPGKLQEELNRCYYNISTDVYMNKNYNTHNQFLDYWCAMGIAAPILLLSIFFFYIKRNYLDKNLIPICIALLYFICMLTENILLRHTGIVSFTLLMALNCYQETETP